MATTMAMTPMAMPALAPVDMEEGAWVLEVDEAEDEVDAAAETVVVTVAAALRVGVDAAAALVVIVEEEEEEEEEVVGTANINQQQIGKQ